MVLAILDDLLFRSKLETAAAHAGVPLQVARDVPPLDAAGDPVSWRLVIVDLDGSRRDPREVMTALRLLTPTAPVVGYYSHLDTERGLRARQAGYTMVWPRSVFVQRLPELLAGKLPL
ncbi:MAG: hypothetical protein HYZ89_02580 [Candidatus Omnitrophica bacterium]|nr:hypothetical protein [Candidatus Omnitrophota bacterium]